ncbi:MAG: hypothetical protein HDR19_00005 [Lachnospiraceae bacterium]|nr:hypothetical protein [Lachnospiraceae bacterium]
MALLIMQILYMLYWGNAKGGFYVDEFFSFDNAHYLSASTPKRIKLYDADFMEYGKWFQLSDLKETLAVTKEIALYQDSFGHNIKTLLKSAYNWMLNYVEALFFPGEVNKWSGISINVVLFVLCQVFLYLLSSKVSENSLAALIACAMYGFSGLVVSMVVYVRFYVLANLWMLIFLYLHVLMWEEKNIRKNILYEMIAVFVLFLGYRMSPLAAIMGIGEILCFSVALGIKKRWLQIGYYTVPILLGGIVYAALFTDYLKMFRDPSAAAQGGYGAAKTSLLVSLVRLTPSSFVTRAASLVEIINDYLFGHVYVLLLFAVLCIYSVIREFRKKQKRLFIYVVVLGASLFYFIASVCFKLGTIRYNSFLYPLLAMMIADMVSALLNKEKTGKAAAVLLALALIGELYYTVSIPRIQNLYPEEKAQVEIIRQNNGIDNIVVDYHFNDRVIYECLAYGDEGTKVMFQHLDEADFTDKGSAILVWQPANESDEILPYLEEAGYSYVEQIAVTHESKIFLCRKVNV